MTKKTYSTYNKVKLTKGDIIHFAEYIMNHPEIVEELKRQLDWENFSDEENEDGAYIVNQFRDKYLKDNDLTYLVSIAYGDAFKLVTFKIKGKINNVNSPEARELLQNSLFVEYIDEEQ